MIEKELAKALNLELLERHDGLFVLLAFGCSYRSVYESSDVHTIVDYLRRQCSDKFKREERVLQTGINQAKAVVDTLTEELQDLRVNGTTLGVYKGPL